jgi:hypothetical protein
MGTFTSTLAPVAVLLAALVLPGGVSSPAVAVDTGGTRSPVTR